MIGGAQDGTRFAPTLVEAVPRSARLFREEVFGPVTVLEPFDLLDEAIDLANGEEFALQHAVFTSTLDHALVAADGRMPFGGSSRSGIGREGVRFAVHEMTQPKVVCITARHAI